MFSSCLHGYSQVTVSSVCVIGPVLIADILVIDPEPQIKSTAVAQSQPDVGCAGILGFLFNQFLLFKVCDGDQVMIVLSAVIYSLVPVFPFIDQDQLFCHDQTDVQFKLNEIRFLDFLPQIQKYMRNKQKKTKN